MSHAAIRWARQQRTGSAPAKAVLMMLAAHADPAGHCYPSVEIITAESELSERATRNAIATLSSRGLVTVRKQRRKDGTQAASAYTLHIDREQTASRAGRQGAPPAPGQGAGNGSQQGAPPAPLVLPTEVLEAREREGEQQPRARKIATNGSAASLNATAHTPLAHEIIASWSAAHPGVLLTVRRELARAVDQLMHDGADPTLVQAALDEADGNPEWRNPTKALPYAYDRVRRAAAARASPQPPARVPTTTARVAAIEAFRIPDGSHTA